MQEETSEISSSKKSKALKMLDFEEAYQDEEDKSNDSME